MACAHVAALHPGVEQLVQQLASLLAKAGRAPQQGAPQGAEDSKGNHECVKCGSRAFGSSKLQCGHAVSLDQERLELYCSECHDYVYSEQFDHALQLYATHAMTCKGRPLIVPPSDPISKRQRTQQHPPAPTNGMPNGSGGGDASTATTGAPPSTCGRLIGVQRRTFTAPDGFPLGLRGLNNLGNTCFMNSVLQVLFQVPLLRNFYLGEGHDPSSCRRALHDKPCLSCQMDGVFSEVYSGKRVPYSPAEFLYHWWLSDEGLAGYQQHDAHEFFLSLLDKLDRGSIVSDALPGQQAAAAAAGRGAAAPRCFLGAGRQRQRRDGPEGRGRQ